MNRLLLFLFMVPLFLFAQPAEDPEFDFPCSDFNEMAEILQRDPESLKGALSYNHSYALLREIEGFTGRYYDRPRSEENYIEWSFSKTFPKEEKEAAIAYGKQSAITMKGCIDGFDDLRCGDSKTLDLECFLLHESNTDMENLVLDRMYGVVQVSFSPPAGQYYVFVKLRLP
jgi:hypothetical protein